MAGAAVPQDHLMPVESAGLCPYVKASTCMKHLIDGRSKPPAPVYVSLLAVVVSNPDAIG